MSFTPFARFRNFTLENLKALLEVYPDMADSIPWEVAKDYAEEKSKGYKRTAYQQACQLGLEDRENENFRIHNYLYTFDDDNLKKYLVFWFKTYFAPNPYVNSDDEPVLIYCKLCEEIINSEKHRIYFEDFVSKNIGGKSDDILLNTIKAFASPVKCIKTGTGDVLYADIENIGQIKEEKKFIEENFPIVNPKSQHDFFERYSFENFCKFYGVTEEQIKNNNIRAIISNNIEKTSFIPPANNVLLYGVPGCGKSYKIKTEYCNDESVMERIVFHPDYTNSDFIGQILPKNKNGNISYHFIPGPFTRIMKKAYQNPDKMHYLVIEEINRGNAPAIFGEVFQLLDRENGTSVYGINNADIAKEIYLKNKETASEEEIKAAEAHVIKIPANLTVLATMNTADQNVFTLDTAFKRRWKMRCIKNNFDECDRSELIIGSTEITWKTFAEVINNTIASKNTSTISSEDKRLGAYFVSKEELQSNRLFAEKVLAYLWDDVFKYERENIFSAEIQLLDELIDKFDNCGIGAFSTQLQTELISY